MTDLDLRPEQHTAVVHPDRYTLLRGGAGTGKTTVLQHRLHHLLTAEKAPAYTILVLVAEPFHRHKFMSFVHESGVTATADLTVTNYVGLAREMVRTFWPLVARSAGFAAAYTPPTWLSYDMAQLLMWEVVDPMLREGGFADLRLRPQQIVSQLLDNLNRAALNGLEVKEAIGRQIRSWSTEAEHTHHLQDAEKAANLFRQRCHGSNLLDLSLVAEVFSRYVVGHPDFRRYFSERFRHLLVDNIEEQTAVGQRFVDQLMGATQTTMIALDEGGGYKRFLAADPNLARRFEQKCDQTILFEHRFAQERNLADVAQAVRAYLLGARRVKTAVDTDQVRAGILGTVTGRYRREMLVRLGPELRRMIDENDDLAPADIAIIVPYLDGALRYKLTQSLREAGIPYQLRRRRASPREEPYVRAWLTWLAIAHPLWDVTRPSVYDVSEALALSIHGLDPARAALVTYSLYQEPTGTFRDPAELTEKQRTRIGPKMVARVTELCAWLDERQATAERPLDFFIHDLFAELLAQPQFTPAPDKQAAAVCDWLVQIATRLREAAEPMGLETERDIGRAFIDGIRNGLVTAHPPDMGDPPDPNGVYISTIYGFLLSERVVPVQVWLETAATGWWDIPRQPLSNGFVLSETWSADQQWTLEDDVRIRNEMLSRVVTGLAGRCRRGILLATSELDRRGVRQDGPLWRALQPFTG